MTTSIDYEMTSPYTLKAKCPIPPLGRVSRKHTKTIPETLAHAKKLRLGELEVRREIVLPGGFSSRSPFGEGRGCLEGMRDSSEFYFIYVWDGKSLCRI
jgi:hypothetical protein